MTVIPETQRSPKDSGLCFVTLDEPIRSAPITFGSTSPAGYQRPCPPAQCRSDIVLAVYEAVANVVEHAYTGRPQRGTVTIDAATAAQPGRCASPRHLAPANPVPIGLPLINALCGAPTAQTHTKYSLIEHASSAHVCCVHQLTSRTRSSPTLSEHLPGTDYAAITTLTPTGVVTTAAATDASLRPAVVVLNV